MIKDDQIGWTRHHHHFAYTALIQQQPHLNPTPYLKPGHSVQVYSNQKEIASNITAAIEPTLPSYGTLYEPPLAKWIPRVLGIPRNSNLFQDMQMSKDKKPWNIWEYLGMG